MLTAESAFRACQKVEWSFGLDAEEVLSLGAGWPLPLSAGPLRPQALPSAPCPFWKLEGSHSIRAFTFRELASAQGRARACLLLPALSLAASYLNLVLVQAMPLLQGPPSSLLSACWLLPPRLSSSTISSPSFSSPPSLTVPHCSILPSLLSNSDASVRVKVGVFFPF